MVSKIISESFLILNTLKSAFFHLNEVANQEYKIVFLTM